MRVTSNLKVYFKKYLIPYENYKLTYCPKKKDCSKYLIHSKICLKGFINH